MTSMTAVVKAAAGPGAEIDQVDVPEPKGADVLIEVAASSICGTDVHIFDWNEWAQRHIKPPRVFGHEMSGRIVVTGPDVQDLPPGTFVAAETHVVDHTCRQCRRGLYHLCENTRVLGVDRDGSFARYVLLPAENCWRNAPGLSPEVAAMQEPFGNAVHAATAADGSACSASVTSRSRSTSTTWWSPKGSRSTASSVGASGTRGNGPRAISAPARSTSRRSSPTASRSTTSRRRWPR